MILADSGFWIALGNRRDRHHAAARGALDRYSAEGFVSTWPVLTEVTHLLSARVGVTQSVAFIDSIAQRRVRNSRAAGRCAVARACADEPLPRPADGSCRRFAGDPGRGSGRRPHSVDRSARLRRLSLEEYAAFQNFLFAIIHDRGNRKRFHDRDSTEQHRSSISEPDRHARVRLSGARHAGKTQRGVLQGDTARAVRGSLRERGLSPLSVEEVREGGAQSRGVFARRGIGGAELALLTRQLATLIGAGLPIDEALERVVRAGRQRAPARHDRRASRARDGRREPRAGDGRVSGKFSRHLPRHGRCRRAIGPARHRARKARRLCRSARCAEAEDPRGARVSGAARDRRARGRRWASDLGRAADRRRVRESASDIAAARRAR